MERDEISMLVARNIQAVMARRGLDRAEVNRRARLSQTGVNDILTGKSRNPGIGTLQKIAENALKVPVFSLLMEPRDDILEQEIFEIFGLLPDMERQRFVRLARAMFEDRQIDGNQEQPASNVED